MSTKARISTHELLLRAVTEKYASDPCKPGLVTSYLGSGEFYASIVRYRDQYAKDKFRVLGAKGTTLDEAIDTLSKEWTLNSNAFNDLRDRCR